MSRDATLSEPWWPNYGRTVYSTSDVYRPHTITELCDFVRDNAERASPVKLKACGPRHTYAEGPIARHGTESQRQIVIDLNHWQEMQVCASTLDDRRQVARISPAVQFTDLCEFLERHGQRVPNTTGCLNLSLGGTFSMGAHGSGHQACVTDFVETIDAVTWQGDLVRFRVGDELFQAYGGGMGTLGIIVSMDIRLEADTMVSEHFTVWRTLDTFLCHERERHETQVAGRPGDLDYWMWLPLDDSIIAFQRRKTDQWMPRPRKQRVFSALMGGVAPPALKLINSLVQYHWVDPQPTYQLLRTSLRLTLPLQTNHNTLYRLQKPISDLVVSTDRWYQCSYDCEMFVPVQHMPAALHVFSWLFRLVRDRSSNRTRRTYARQHQVTRRYIAHAKQCAPDLFHWKRLQALLGSTEALVVVPVLIRYCPATSVGWCAPNYQRDVYAFSFTWFGTLAIKHHYERLMDWLLDVSVACFTARIHFGKYHRVLTMPRSWLRRYQRAYEPSWTAQRQAILRHDPQLVFQNDLTRRWFNLPTRHETRARHF